ncbi:CDP-glycerol glycerophosphotransferase family protein, partial [Pseudodesulfovibrio sp.]|nr:CDP-glycerol glycerophosphotransferase family protein [Pseudodesulfovibrio sp.]
HVHKMLRSENLPCYLFPEEDAIEKLAQAATIVVDSFNFREHLFSPLTNHARIIQLWHGVGFKEIGFVELKTELVWKDKNLDIERFYSNYHTVVSTSPFYTKEVFSKSFKADNIVDLGYPRNDILFKQTDKNSMINCDMASFNKVLEMRKRTKTVLYAPTFRDDGSPMFANWLDFEALHNFLLESNIHLLIKAHQYSPVELASNLSNITIYDNATDVYPLLPHVDIMVTDYSSIYMDYLLLDRPVIFFCPDYERYVTHNRQFQFPYEEMTPGPKCRTQDALHDALTSAASGVDEYADDRAALREKAFLHLDGNSAQRITDYICQVIQE